MAQLKAAFNNANNKDVQLQADLVELNNKRKKYKQQLVTERKNLTDLEKVPEKNKSVKKYNFIKILYLYYIVYVID